MVYFSFAHLFLFILDNVSYSWNVNENEKNVIAGMVLDYKERFDSTLSAINDELKNL